MDNTKKHAKHSSLRLTGLLMAMQMLAAPAATAQTANQQVVNGSVLDINGRPVAGATVVVSGASQGVATDINGSFAIAVDDPYVEYVVTAPNYESSVYTLVKGQDGNFVVVLSPDQQSASADMFFGEFDDLTFDENVLEDEEGSSQNVAALTGANDNIFYSTASYNFGPMYYRFRGYDSQYQKVYLNGVEMNDLLRGRFNFSSLLGMTSRAFRNKTTTIGTDAAAYGFGDVGGSVNYNTLTEAYAPGFNGSVAFTNSNYMVRGMVTYATGLNSKGWALTVSAIGRYAKEGVVEGTFYNSGGIFLSLEKRFDAHNSLTLTAFGGPTQRATASATYQEAYDLAGSNLYNPNWGYYQGDKRAARITETFDPTVMLNWLYRKGNTMVNTAAALRWVNYSSSALQYYKANDPNPTYYRYLPSYYKDNEELFDLYTYNWENDVNTRQIKWDDLYFINQLNNEQNKTLPADEQKGSSYIQENRVSNQLNAMFNVYLNQKLNSWMTLQGGASFNYTDGSFYKTVRDLMGGQFWLDVDPFSDRDITLKPDNLQNDLDNPNRHVQKGDRFGYDYNMHALKAQAWLQNQITLPQWDIYYGFNIAYTQMQRIGHMRNGRAPENSLGNGKLHTFDDAAIKAGATYKINGRNYLLVNAEYGTRAPLVDNIYIAPRIKDDVCANPTSERVFSIDGTYMWNYRRFRGNITAFYTQMDNVTERFGFYDEQYTTYTNFVLSGVKRVYKGVELGMSYKITPSVTATFAGTYAKYQYKNNPEGTRSFENGLYPDTTQTVYLKNFYAGSVPQSVFNVGIDWAAPKSWFFGINGTWQGDAYVNLSPAYHEVMPGLADAYPGYDEAQLAGVIENLCGQDKLKDAFSLNISIGKLMYINRKVSLNINLNINNVLNNKNVVTYAYQQGRLDTKNYDRNAYPNRYTYAQGVRAFLNIGVRF